MTQQLIEAQFKRALEHLQGGEPKLAQSLLASLHHSFPAHPDILFLLGVSATMLGERAEAIRLYDKLLNLAPDFVPALNAKGLDLAALGKHVEALAVFDSALQIAPEFIDALLNKAALLNELARYCESVNLLLPHRDSPHPQLRLNLGVAYFHLGEYAQAEQCAQSVLKQTPQESGALALMGAICLKQKCLPEALAYCQQSATLNPRDASVLNNIATILSEQGRFSEAADAYEHTLMVDSAYPFAKGALLHTRMKAVIWNDYDELIAQIRTGIEAEQKISDPFSILATNLDAPTQKKCAELYVKALCPPVESFTSWNCSHDGKIRVAYLSADFFNHATAFLMAELFELHDRNQFEIIGICYGRSPDDAMRQRVSGAFDQFYTVVDKSDQEIAKLIHGLSVDVAVDLKGHTAETRLGVLGYRPAPVQVHYLGYPGTTGAPFIDYLVADSVLIPPRQQSFYTEKIAYLPECYQVNDTKRQISERIFTRTELGLPATGFVFCCFNNNFKITPDLFDVWMRILNRVEGSVLWLFQDNPVAAVNLRKEAVNRGVDAGRLVFAERLPLAEHLARHRCADLFLDTWYCNAHTTASDALWAGLPIVTKIVDTFAGRVAASLLHAVGLSELVVSTAEAYEALAYNLATEHGRLSKIKSDLAENIKTSYLFDTSNFVKDLEALWIDLAQNGRNQILAKANDL